MMNPFNFFRKLRWKFALSYMVVTTTVVLLLISLVWLAFWLLLVQSGQWQTVVQGIATGVATDVSEEFSAEPIEVDAIEAWLGVLDLQTFSRGNDQNTQTKMDFSLDSNDFHYIVAVDSRGQILATNPPSLGWEGDITNHIPSASVSVYKRSLELNENVILNRYKTDTGDSVMFVPVIHDGNEIVGTLVMEIDPTSGATALRIWSFVGVVLIVVLLSIPVAMFALFFGLIFGIFASRGMVKRLNRLSTATDSWSSGDFSVRIKDKSKDEIGQLGNNLNHMTEQIQQLLESRSELAMIEERNRLARDLHDAAKQQIFAATMQLTTAKMLLDVNPEAAKKHLVEAEVLARQVQTELSGLIEELRPAQLEGTGLFLAVRHSAESFVRQNKIPVEFRMQGQRELPLIMEQTIFRVFQEVMSNIAKHSQATQVNVYIAATNEKFSLTIEDNGIGFDPHTTSSGLGMRSMRERTELVGGTFNLKTQVGHGTIVQIQCPLNQIITPE